MTAAQGYHGSAHDQIRRCRTYLGDLAIPGKSRAAQLGSLYDFNGFPFDRLKVRRDTSNDFNGILRADAVNWPEGKTPDRGHAIEIRLFCRWAQACPDARP